MISEQQIKLWCAGGAELKFVFAHLVEEFVFSRENPAECNIVPSSVDARGENRILRCEEETIH